MTASLATARHLRVATGGTGGDVSELRLDAMWSTPPSEEEAVAALEPLADAPSPVLATLRPLRQGGGFDGPEEVRVSLLAAAAAAGAVMVDLEADLPELAHLVTGLGVPVVASDHTLQDAPSEKDGLHRLQVMQDSGAAVQKLAFPVGSFMDHVRALQLAHGHSRRAGRPAIAPLGGSAQLRALLPLAGNVLTYGHGVGSKPAVSGQPALADVQAVWGHWGLDPATCSDRWFAVLGASVGHSLSPRIHNAAFRAGGRPERFGALDVPASTGAFRLLAKAATRIGLAGASVTNPHKPVCLEVGEPDEVAAAVGAANCIRLSDFACTNTDATALRAMLEGAADVVVLGAGGAARAAIWAAQERGLDVTFTSRDVERAAAVKADLEAPWTPWDQRNDLRASTWVQATTVGDAALIDAPALEGASRWVEMVYGDGPTPAQMMAKEAGLEVDDGRRLLLEQAVDAYRFWTGEEPDRGAMEAAL